MSDRMALDDTAPATTYWRRPIFGENPTTDVLAAVTAERGTRLDHCGAEHPRGYPCFRAPHEGGRHIAIGAPTARRRREIVAAWPGTHTPTPADVAVPTTPPVPAPTPSGGAVAVAAGVESSESRRSSSGGRPQARHARMSVPAVETGPHLMPPVEVLQAAVAGVTPGAERAVWLADADGTLLHPIGQPVTDPLQVAERVTQAAVLIEQGRGADWVTLLVGKGDRDELLHTRALVEACGRSRNQQDLPGRGPYAEIGSRS
jgi:hypothetical protein